MSECSCDKPYWDVLWRLCFCFFPFVLSLLILCIVADVDSGVAVVFYRDVDVDGLRLFVTARLRSHSHAAFFPGPLFALFARVPSECWPIVACGGGEGNVFGPSQVHKSELYFAGDMLVLCLKSRKNRPEGSRLVRSCWCSRCTLTCPVHVLGPYFQCVHSWGSHWMCINICMPHHAGLSQLVLNRSKESPQTRVSRPCGLC